MRDKFGSKSWAMCAALALAVAVATGASGPASAKPAATPPAAVAAGYRTLTFAVDSFDPTTFDAAASLKSGFKFYPFTFFSANRKAFSNTFDQGVLLARGNSASAASIACQNGPCNQWVGTAFGGGAYIEAEVAYDETKINQATHHWPAVWTQPIESVTQSAGFQWDGQPAGYHHAVEVDLLEQQFPAHPRRFSSAVHDWYGLYDKSCPGQHHCQVATGRSFDPPASLDFKAFHKIAVLWITATNTRKGSLTFYYDGVPTGAPVTWQKYDGRQNHPPIPRDAPWVFGAVDGQHLSLIVGGGDIDPMRVRSVHVWQASAAGNIVR